MTDQQHPSLLTIAETARWLNVSASTVRRRIASGELGAVKLGEARAAPVRVPPDEVSRWLHSARGGPRAR